jgi:hypothetical protein
LTFTKKHQKAGLSYTDDKAMRILTEILGGREPKSDDAFAAQDFYSMFFTLKTWVQQSEEDQDVLLSESLEVRFQAFVKSKKSSATAVPQLQLISPTTGQPTAPKYPHLSFPVQELRRGDELASTLLRDGEGMVVYTSLLKGVDHCCF